MKYPYTFLWLLCLALFARAGTASAQQTITSSTLVTPGSTIKTSFSGASSLLDNYSQGGIPINLTDVERVYRFTLTDSAQVTFRGIDTYTTRPDGLVVLNEPSQSMILLDFNNTYSVLASSNTYLPNSYKRILSAKVGPGTHYLVLESAGTGDLNCGFTFEQYCIPNSSPAAPYFLSKFRFNIVSSDSILVPRGRYMNYSTDFSEPNPYTFSMRLGQANTYALSHPTPMYDRIFIDFNRDLDFNDPGELVVKSASPVQYRTGSFTLPYNDPRLQALLAKGDPYRYTRMRIQSSSTLLDSTVAPCAAAFAQGSTVDIDLYVYPPLLGVTLASTPPYCPVTGAFVILTVNGAVAPAGPYVVNEMAPNSLTQFNGLYSTAQTTNFTSASGTARVAVPEGYYDNHFFTASTPSFITDPVKSTSFSVKDTAAVSVRNNPAGCNGASIPVRFYISNVSQLNIYARRAAGTLLGTVSGLAGKDTAIFLLNSLSFTTDSAKNNTIFLYAEPTPSNGCSSGRRIPIKCIIYRTPQVTSVTPVDAHPGTVVTLRGNYLDNASSVRMGGVLTSYNVIQSGQQISTTAPAGMTNNQVTVQNSCASSTTTGAFAPVAPLSNDWRWVRTGSAATFGGQARFNRVRTDAGGNHYAVGSFNGTVIFDNAATGTGPIRDTSAGLQDGMLCRYTRRGQLGYVVQFAGTGNDEVLGLAVDKFSYAYVSGYFTGTMKIKPASGAGATLVSAGGTDMFVAKIHPNGTLVWAFRMGSTGDDRANGIDVAPDLRFYVAGSFIGNTAIGGISGTVVPLTSKGNSDAFLAKFSDIGTLYWAIQAGGSGNDFGYGAAADVSGGGYLMGSYEGTAVFASSLGGTTGFAKTAVGGSDGFVLGVSVTGQLNWVSSMGGSTNENVRDLAPDPRGNGVVAVGGFSSTASFDAAGTLTPKGFYDAFATRLNQNGAFVWAVRAGGFGQEQAWSVRLGRTGIPYVAMSSTGSGVSMGAPTLNDVYYTQGKTDALILTLDPNTGVSTNLEQIAGIDDDFAYGIDTVSSGGIIAAGYLGQNTRFGLLGPYTSPYPAGSAYQTGWVARYSTLASATREGVAEIPVPARASGLRAWPNPSRAGSALYLELEDGAKGQASVEIFALDGRRVWQGTQTLEGLNAGSESIPSPPTGTYLIRLQTATGARHTTRIVVE